MLTVSSDNNFLQGGSNPTKLVEGAVEFTQNLFTGSNTQYTVWLRGDNMEGKNYAIGLMTDCSTPSTFEVRSSSVLIRQLTEVF